MSLDFQRSVSDFLKFLTDERGTGIIKGFAAMGQAYADLRSSSLHGVASANLEKKSKKKTERTNDEKQSGAAHQARNSSAADVEDDNADSGGSSDDDEQRNSLFSIHSATRSLQRATEAKIASATSRAQTAWAAISPLLAEMNTLLLRVKERAFSLKLKLRQQQQQQQQHSCGELEATLDQIVVHKLQTKVITAQLLFRELRTALDEQKWGRLSVEQLRVYQTALVAEFSFDAEGSAVAQHPLESLSVLMERVKSI